MLTVSMPGERWDWHVAAYKLGGGGLILLGNELYLLSQSAAERTVPRPGADTSPAAAAPLHAAADGPGPQPAGRGAASTFV